MIRTSSADASIKSAEGLAPSSTAANYRTASFRQWCIGGGCAVDAGGQRERRSAPTRKLYDPFWAIHGMKEQNPPDVVAAKREVVILSLPDAE
jgi:hypothetical protein